MPRQLRIEFPGAIHHVTSRGNRAKPIYLDAVDRQSFLELLGEACHKTGWQVHAYCLMRNHFHLVIETPKANLMEGMHWLLSSYISRFNRRGNRFGHVFAGRYKTVVVEGGGQGYLRTACDHVHLNPARAKLLGAQERLRMYPWSSLRGYVTPERRPDWMRVDRLLREHGIRRDTAAGRKEFERLMELRRREDADGQEWKPLRRGWVLGSKKFRGKLLRGGLRKRHSRRRRRKSRSDTAQAETIIAEELKRARWKEKDLKERLKGHPTKLAIAVRLRRETTLTVRHIAQRLHMGAWESLNSRLCPALRAARRKRAKGAVI